MTQEQIELYKSESFKIRLTNEVNELENLSFETIENMLKTKFSENVYSNELLLIIIIILLKREQVI